MPRYRLLFLLAASLLPGAVAAAEPKVIALPPYLVEESAKPLPWRYADVAGWEVLSTCSDRLTRELVANHHRLHILLAELLPPTLQLNLSVKGTLLFVDSAHQPPTSQEVVAQMALTAAEQDRLDDVVVPIDDGRLRRRPPPPRYTYLPNLRLWDRDAGALFAMVKESEFNASRVALTSDYVAYLLRNRLPALPPWYVSGVLSLFARARFTEDALTIDRLDWLSETGSAALKSGPAANRALLPLGEFLAGDLSSGDPAQGETLSLWQAQSALFVHWGLAGRGAPRRTAFWTFAARAATESVTEALFRECFGLDFATAQQQLTAHLAEAMRDRLALRPATRPRLPEFPLRPASEGEIARIKGEWERLEIGFVKAHFPVLVSKYVAQARRTLRRAEERGHRDAPLLAVMGLCEVDAGDDGAARDFLEAAAADNTPLRPRAGFELARLRFAALRAARAGAAPGLNAGEAGTVLTPLLGTRSQQPPLPEVYELIAEVWATSAQAPARADLAVLEEGVRLFPRRVELVHRTAELSLRHGFTDTARWLISLGLNLAPDAATRARFESLQARAGAVR
ncbi:hypothetical protein [Horticoccus sp. 23ND18S-11]|uniref:hypothetical protein n=1 Tax=Horticoccus sp. 23ND18S-11 TaxID=3391832 RepID=UPI0039C8F483